MPTTRQRDVGGRAQEIVQPLEGVAVGPLQVVDDENERSRRAECLRERLEEAQALPALQLQGRVAGPRAAPRATAGMQPGDIGQPGRIQLRQCGPQRRRFSASAAIGA